MSIKVAPDELPLDDFGNAGYVITTGDDGVAHVAHMVLEYSGSELRCGAGRSSAANAAARPDIVVLWPPHEPGGMSLIVDGRAEVAAADPADPEAGQALVITVTSGVLHRPAQ